MSGPVTSPPTNGGRNRFGVIAGLVAAAVLLVAGALVVLRGVEHRAGPPPVTDSAAADSGDGVGEQGIPVPPVPAEKLAALPEATTYTALPGPPRDPAPDGVTDGTVVHPTRVMAVFDTTGGLPIARLPVQQLPGSDTWLPVIDRRPGWVQVLLPVRPNGTVGWLAEDADVVEAHTPTLIRVHRAAMTMEVLTEGQPPRQFRVGVGTPHDPTPVGRTFLLATYSDAQQRFSPLISALGTHSTVLASFGGGPGTVAIHGWPTTSVLGTQASNGCVRVGPDALQLVSAAPLGTEVAITDD